MDTHRSLEEELFGESPIAQQNGAPPLSALELQEKLHELHLRGEQGPVPGDRTIFVHCRACGSFMSYFWDYVDLHSLNLTHENVVGHYVEASECCWCNRSVGFLQPRLRPLPTYS